MPSPIEDYALIGDCRTAALVSREGSIDWLCFPRFDSASCFAALLGERDHGRWKIAPAGEIRSLRRRYREGTLVLETDFATDEGEVTLVDCMPFGDGRCSRIFRSVIGRRGQVRMQSDLLLRFDYGRTMPWVRAVPGGINAIAGPDGLLVQADVPLTGKDFATVAEFTVSEGQTVSFAATWYPSFEPPPSPVDVVERIAHTTEAWRTWASNCTYEGPWREAVLRSLITLKALTHADTGGIVAAATTSLPEHIGGVRNWDYRFCWVRDATFTLYSLVHAGFYDEAKAWRSWLLRAAAGKPSDLQIMYGIAGERRLTEQIIPWLGGYEGSAPVRIGNAASTQLQLDVYGELIDSMHQGHRIGIDPNGDAWRLQRALLEALHELWQEPDEGIWEVRGPRRHFTHSKVMAWVAMDRGIKSVENFGFEGPVDKWRAARAAIFEQVCREGFDAERGSFMQYYGSKEVDASLLMMPLVGFLPAEDPRIRGTIAAIEKDLLRGGFVNRYPCKEAVDGLPVGEGAFLACTFWFADNLALIGREADARAIFERLLAIRNDVGLLSEEYDPRVRRFLGNFPQAFSHVSLVNTALNLSKGGDEGPAASRRRT